MNESPLSNWRFSGRQSHQKQFKVQHMRRAKMPSCAERNVQSFARKVGTLGGGSEVALHVQREMVATGEGSLAQLALERSVAGVLAVVARQLVGARELPPAALPAAQVRLLARVSAVMRLQVRALRVRLVAARVAARVVHLSLAAPRASSALPRRLQLGAVGRLQRQQQVHELGR